MEYVYGTAVIGGVTRENLKVIGGPPLAEGEYFTTVREYEDSTITDRCRIEQMYDSAEGADGTEYAFYIISEHYRYIDRTKTLNSTKEATEIAFVVMAEAGSIDAATAGEYKEMFPEWQPDVNYTVGQYRRFGDKLYRCVQAHTSQAGWEPDKAASLWAVAADPEEEWPAWSQPLGAHDAYALGAKVSHKERHWVSDVDNNVWEPGVANWTEVVAEASE